jgi:hypothetical protein
MQPVWQGYLVTVRLCDPWLWAGLLVKSGCADRAEPVAIEEDRPRPLVAPGIDQEKRLESILADDIKILGLGP